MANVSQSRTKCNKDSTVLIVTHSVMLRHRTCHCILLISPPKGFFFFILQTAVLLCLDKNKDVFFFRLPYSLNIQSQNMFLPSVQVWCYFIHDPVTLPPPLPHTEKGRQPDDEVKVYYVPSWPEQPTQHIPSEAIHQRQGFVEGERETLKRVSVSKLFAWWMKRGENSCLTQDRLN